MIICLIGHSASGKSTLEKELVKDGFEKIISYTTRPPRKGEIDGVDYHFISTEQFMEMDKQGKFQETAKYRDWLYGLSLDGVDYKNKHYIAVVTIHGYAELLKAVGKENIIAIYVCVDERERAMRLLKRGDDIDEIMRRIKADRDDFRYVDLICDYTVRNDDIVKAKKEILNIISNAK
jgi:guanylate kinase